MTTAPVATPLTLMEPSKSGKSCGAYGKRANASSLSSTPRPGAVGASRCPSSNTSVSFTSSLRQGTSTLTVSSTEKFGMATGVRHVGLQNVDRLLGQGLQETGRLVPALARGDWHRGIGAHVRKRIDRL